MRRLIVATIIALIVVAVWFFYPAAISSAVGHAFGAFIAIILVALTLIALVFLWAKRESVRAMMRRGPHHTPDVLTGEEDETSYLTYILAALAVIIVFFGRDLLGQIMLVIMSAKEWLFWLPVSCLILWLSPGEKNSSIKYGVTALAIIAFLVAFTNTDWVKQETAQADVAISANTAVKPAKKAGPRWSGWSTVAAGECGFTIWARKNKPYFHADFLNIPRLDDEEHLYANSLIKPTHGRRANWNPDDDWVKNDGRTFRAIKICGGSGDRTFRYCFSKTKAKNGKAICS